MKEILTFTLIMTVLSLAIDAWRSRVGWFFGFKLQLVVNHLSDILSVKITEGNVEDRSPVPDMVGALSGSKL